MAGEQLCGRDPRGLGGHQAEQEPSVWPGSQQRLYGQKYGQETERCDYGDMDVSEGI